jgi:hypothetical protein
VVDSTYVRTVDVVPTIARLLHIRLNWHADGRSAFARSTQARRVVSMPSRDFSHSVRVTARRLEQKRRGLLAHKLALFGSGAGAPGLFGIGPRPDLLGRPVAGFRVRSARRLNARLSGPAAAGVTGPGLVPALVAGTVRGDLRPGRQLLVGVNGRVAATSRTFRLRGTRLEQFSVMVPEASLRPGRNSFDLLTPVGSHGQLARMRIATRRSVRSGRGL